MMYLKRLSLFTFRRWLYTITVAHLLCTSLIWSQDKNGVSPNTISRPSGPGSLEGLGDAFQPSLNTGMARYGMSINLPGGITGFTPALSFSYDSGNGFGPAGIGWSFDVGSIRRQSDKALPRYGETIAGMTGPDRFLGMDGEELIPLQNGYYLAKIEGKFIRCKQIDNHWIAHTKGGTKLEFGLTDLGRISDSTGQKIFRWCLQRQTNTNGNVIEYNYSRPVENDRQLYLSEILYGPGSPPWDHKYRVIISYEDRPDTWTDYRSGFMVRTSKRVSHIDTYYDQDLIHRYTVEYGASADWSLLTTITRLGDDAVSALPSTTFGYATVNLPDPQTPISALSQTITSTTNIFAAMDNAKADLVDVNMDALPDLLFTDAGHIVYLNRGVTEVKPGQRQIQWEGPISMGAAQQQTLNIDLSSANVHLADMTGDGVSDLVVTESQWVEYFTNQGDATWGTGQLMAVEKSPPPAPFGMGGSSIKTTDLDFDKRIDIIKSDFGVYSVWFNLGGGSYSDEVLVDGAFYQGQFVDFADAGVTLADMNGDRLNDIVKITPISVVYFPNKGYGRFDQGIELFLPDRVLDDTQNGNLHRAKATDINGDGLADLIVERADGNNMWFFLNMSNGTFASSRVITDLPSTPSSVIRWADINGNGTTDIIYADSSLQGSKINAVDLGVLITGTPFLNALTSIDNGYGRKTEIQYRSSTEFYLDSIANNHPWDQTLPISVGVVSKTVTSIHLDLDGYPDEGPDGDQYITDFVYRDGYYDPIEKQFRGFSFVKMIERGDERFGGNLAPTLVTRHGFHTGAPDGVDNDNDGLTDEFHPWNGREEEPLKGMELWRETTSLPDDPLQDGRFASDTIVFEHVETSWEIHDLSTETAGTIPMLFDDQYRTNDNYQRVIRHAVRTQINTTLVERQTDTLTHKHLESRFDLDPLGNDLFNWNLGDTSNPNDDLYTGYEYAMNEPDWIVGHNSRTFQREGGPGGAFVSDVRNYYDGEAYIGLPLGQVGARGNLHRTETILSEGPTPAITERSYLLGDPRYPTGKISSLRQKFDAFGNAIVILDALATLTPQGNPDGGGHERRITYDTLLHRFPSEELIVLGNGKPDLSVHATYHFGFGTPLIVSDFNGNNTHYEYDTFGRLKSETMPGDDPLLPTKRYDYDWTSPFSKNTTTLHTKEGDSPDVVTNDFFDGLGRSLGTWEVGSSVMNNVTMYTPRSQAWKSYQPYFGSPLDKNNQWQLPIPTSAASVTRYDAKGRVIETITPEDANGNQAHLTTQYLPLKVIEHDGEDNVGGGPHENTPQTMIYDGMQRLVEVHEIETLSAVDSGTFITKYRYALPELLAEIEDAKGNIKYMRYDGLGRKIFMNDCDRGHMIFSYDNVGNLIQTVDAKNQQIQYTYGGANRLLTEDYQDSGTPLSLERSPDVIYHYDQPANDYPGFHNTRGQVAWVEDLTGAEFHSFDARNQLDTTIKRINQIGGGNQDWMTVTLADSLGRLYQTTYPDGGIIRQRYNNRGLLFEVSNFVTSLTYRPSAQKETCTFNNGVATTYSYDPRLRLTRIHTVSGEQVLQNLSYSFDQVNNLVGINDNRTLDPNDKRNQTASFIMDNSYRLQQAVGLEYGTIDYDYDRLGSMEVKTSPNIVDDNVNIGQMTSGGLMGTFGRIGRSPGDTPGPHSITVSDNLSKQRIFDYDANGNMTQNDGDEYVFDYEDRLGKVLKNNQDIRYLYDYSDRRVIKRVDGVQTTYINPISEIRDEKLLKYVFADKQRVAQIEGDLPAPPIITQRIMLLQGWNLISFQVTPNATSPATLLGNIDGKYTAVFGFDGNNYLHYIPLVDGGTTLIEMLPNHGYWIFMNESAEWIVEGSLSSEEIQVPSGGMALVGLPGLTLRTQNQISSDNPSMEYIGSFITGDFSFREIRFQQPDFLNSFHTTMPGRGYWIMTGANTLSTDSPAASDKVSFYHSDHLRSTNLITDNIGLLHLENTYYPYGLMRHEYIATKDIFNPLYQFGDKEQDSESGLHYFEARLYDGAIGRFVTVDPMATTDPNLSADVPQGANTFSFAFSNPMLYSDPTGQWPEFIDKAVEKGSGYVDQATGAIGAGADVAFDAFYKAPEKFNKTVGKVGQALKNMSEGRIDAMGKAMANRYNPIATKVGKGLRVAGTVANGIGVFISGNNLGNAIIDRATGKTTESSEIVEHTANTTAGIVSAAGPVGFAGSVGFAGGTALAETIDHNTGWYNGAVAGGNKMADMVRAGGGGEFEANFVGVVSTAVNSINPFRLLD